MKALSQSPIQEFAESFFQKITDEISTVIAGFSGPRIAAFDADGTLWDTDVGESFFDYQILKSGLDLPPDPWDYYHKLKAVDTAKAFMWLAQINAEQPLAKVQSWAKLAVQEKAPFPLFKSQGRLIRFLQKNSFEIFIVTASVKWSVEPAAEFYNVPFENVLGVETKVLNDIVTATPHYPVTWRQGKADALLKATGGIRPILCSGNTIGDLALLEAASHLRLAVGTQDEKNALHDEEMRLFEHAQNAGWLTHRFR